MEHPVVRAHEIVKAAYEVAGVDSVDDIESEPGYADFGEVLRSLGFPDDDFDLVAFAERFEQERPSAPADWSDLIDALLIGWVARGLHDADDE